ncbi:hypothetical protein P3T40_006281 [Paraburkholderia sp. EB58]|jgi:hypothetical protein
MARNCVNPDAIKPPRIRVCFRSDVLTIYAAKYTQLKMGMMMVRTSSLTTWDIFSRLLSKKRHSLPELIAMHILIVKSDRG